MPKTVQKTLTFPLAGVARRRGYREQTRPYATPWAINVRGVGPLESRDRGGSRPGIVKVNSTNVGTVITALLPLTSIDATGARQRDIIIIAGGVISYLRASAISSIDADLLWPDSEIMIWDDGEEVVFDSTVSAVSPIGATDAYHAAARGGKLYLADSVLRVYDPNTGIIDPLLATAGTVPTAQPVICLYRDRLVLTGSTHVYYIARTSDPTDWDYGAEATDVNRAVAGQLEHAGGIGAVPTAAIPYRDQVLILASANSLWALRGDPVTGTMRAVSESIGIISPEAWALSPDGVMAFLSNDGLYLWAVGDSASGLARVSQERVPEELLGIDAATNTITMAYDAVDRGFHLFITPDSGSGTHWWIDLENKAMWPMYFYDNHQPVAVARLEGSGLDEVIMGSKDGYLRKFDVDATTDDNVPIYSHVLLGPFRISRNDTEDALLAEIHGIMADNVSYVDWRVFMGNSAEEVTDIAVAGIKALLVDPADDIDGVAAQGKWVELRNKVERPRSRGPWVVVCLSSDSQWSYEAVAVTGRQLGRLR